MEFREISNKICQFEVEEDSEELLHFLCDCGAVLYFSHESNLSNSLVILDPQWLINVFCEILKSVPSKKDLIQIREKRRILAEDGILSKELINYTCKKLDLQFPQETLLSIMEKCNLICRWNEQNGKEVYLVPSMFTAKPDGEISGLIGQGKLAPIYIQFSSGYVPYGLFCRFLALFGQQISPKCPATPPKLFANAARFFLGQKSNYNLTIACFKSVIAIHLLFEGKCEVGRETASISKHICSVVESVLESLRVQCPWLHSMRWELCARCDLCLTEVEDPEGCSWHHTRPCSHPDCSHFIPLVSKPLRCDRTYRPLSEDKLKPWVKHLRCTDQDPAQLQFKPGVVSADDLLLLARDVGNKWEQLCRILLSEKERQQIDNDKTNLFDKCYATLHTWKGAQGTSATYSALGMAWKMLMEVDPDTEDLCTQYCLKSQGVMESSV